MTSLISVIIPVRDRERYLGEAIASVLAQGWPELDVVVIDDGSRDGSAAVAASFAGVRCVRQPPRGAAAARNAGVAAARGEFVAFLDSDDLWAPGKLARQAEVLAHRPEVDLVFGSVVEFISSELGKEARRRLRADERPRPGYLSGALLGRRVALRTVGAFDETLRAGEFVDWLARARSLGLHVVTLEDVVLRRRIHGGHLSQEPASRRDFLRVVKANIERRRATREEPE